MQQGQVNFTRMEKVVFGQPAAEAENPHHLFRNKWFHPHQTASGYCQHRKSFQRPATQGETRTGTLCDH